MRTRILQRFAVTASAMVLGIVLAAPAQASGGLVLIPELPILVALVVGFTLLIFPLNKLIFQPLFQVLDQRDEKITGARRRADQLESQANEILERYETSIRDIREEAEAHRRSELDAARAEQQQIAGHARNEALGQVEAARAELNSALRDARESLRRTTAELAREAAAQVLGRSLS